MAFNSLKDFVDFLEERKELKRITHRVSPKLEITEIADRLVKTGNSPALLFENVEGSEFPLLINAFASEKRMAWALGVEKLDDLAAELAELIKTQPPQGLLEKIKMVPKLAKVASFMPKKISNGACQEVTMTPPDLTKLPVLTCWPKDGGPFITFGTVYTTDPDTQIRNVGLYRIQVFNGQLTAMHWQMHKTGRRHFERYKEKGEKMPVAIVIGGDPALTWSASAPLPDGIDELLLAGFIRKKSVELVKCKTNELFVPADADFVIEGFVDPKEEFIIEGPFGDHTGYYTPQEPFPKFHVTAITHRKNPIYFTTIVGRPPMEDEWMGKATERIFLPLMQMIYPEVVDMNLPAAACFHNLALISIKKQYPGHAKKMMHSLWGTGQMMTNKALVIFDHDVNIQDTYEVLWRLTNNIDAKRDITFVDGPIDHLDHAAPNQFVGSKMGIDATRKWPEEEHFRTWPEDTAMDEATKKKVDAIWKDLKLS